MSNDIDTELHSMVLGIAADLEAAVDERLYDIDGEPTIIDDIDEWEAEEKQRLIEEFKATHDPEGYDHDLYDSFEEYMEDELDEVDIPDTMSLYEYIDHIGLGDTRFEVDSELTMYAAKTLVAYGGPSIWVHDSFVAGYWGTSEQSISLNNDTQTALWQYFKEILDSSVDTRKS